MVADVWLSLVAMLCVTLLEALALVKGINGKLFALAMSVLGALAGVTIAQVIP